MKLQNILAIVRTYYRLGLQLCSWPDLEGGGGGGGGERPNQEVIRRFNLIVWSVTPVVTMPLFGCG